MSGRRPRGAPAKRLEDRRTVIVRFRLTAAEAELATRAMELDREEMTAVLAKHELAAPPFSLDQWARGVILHAVRKKRGNG